MRFQVEIVKNISNLKLILTTLRRLRFLIRNRPIFYNFLIKIDRFTMSTQILRAPDLLHQAELLKSNVIDENGDVEWQIRLELQRLLENALLIDLDYAVARQVEQMLWNFCFKNCIDAYQNKLRRRKIDSDVAQLQFFLDSCVGYFTQLLGRLSREFNLNLHCYKSDANLGILNGHFRLKKKAESSNLNHVAQFCLIHLGDIARYQKNIDEAGMLMFSHFFSISY